MDQSIGQRIYEAVIDWVDRYQSVHFLRSGMIIDGYGYRWLWLLIAMVIDGCSLYLFIDTMVMNGCD